MIGTFVWVVSGVVLAGISIDRGLWWHWSFVSPACGFKLRICFSLVKCIWWCGQCAVWDFKYVCYCSDDSSKVFYTEFNGWVDWDVFKCPNTFWWPANCLGESVSVLFIIIRYWCMQDCSTVQPITFRSASIPYTMLTFSQCNQQPMDKMKSCSLSLFTRKCITLWW